MKPKTKKTLIIVAALVAVVAIVYFVFIRKKASQSIVDNLDLTADQKAALKAKIAEIEANVAGIEGWTKAEIERKAKEKGVSYAQWLVMEAAYALYYTADWSLYEQIWQQVK